jgi:hypothetical protein
MLVAIEADIIIIIIVRHRILINIDLRLNITIILHKDTIRRMVDIMDHPVASTGHRRIINFNRLCDTMVLLQDFIWVFRVLVFTSIRKE